MTITPLIYMLALVISIVILLVLTLRWYYTSANINYSLGIVNK